MKKSTIMALVGLGVFTLNLQAQTFVNFTITQNPLLTMTAGAGSTICYGDAAVLQGTAAGGDGAYSYAWTPVDSVLAPTSNNTTANPTATTEYIIEVTDGNNCTSYDTVLVNLPTQPLTVDAGTGSTICPGSSAILTATSTGGYGNNSYLWSPSTALSSTTTLITTSTSTTTITYYFTVTDDNLCSLTDSVVVNVLDCSGVEEENNLELLVYPNPSSGIFTISSHLLNNVDISVHSITGSLIYFKSLANMENYSIDLSGAAKGLYVINLESAGQKISKIISIQ